MDLMSLQLADELNRDRARQIAALRGATSAGEALPAFEALRATLHRLARTLVREPRAAH